jgi:hypothetical protein
MTTGELREHDRGACVRDRRMAPQKNGFRVWLSPKDPDRRPDFSIQAINDGALHFRKRSTPQLPIAIELRKIAEDHRRRRESDCAYPPAGPFGVECGFHIVESRAEPDRSPAWKPASDQHGRHDILRLIF